MTATFFPAVSYTHLVVCVPIIFYKSTPMDRVLEHLFVQVDKAYREGANILILSDRGVDENHVAIPSLLAVSAVHKHLVKTKKCTALSIILESGEPREVHLSLIHISWKFPQSIF